MVQGNGLLPFNPKHGINQYWLIRKLKPYFKQITKFVFQGKLFDMSIIFVWALIVSWTSQKT